MSRGGHDGRALAGGAARGARAATAALWRRLPDRVQSHRAVLHPLNRLLLRLGAPPCETARLRAGHRLHLDLRSGTEWFSFYTGRFDDGRLRAARALLDGHSAVAVDAGANIGLWTVPLACHAARRGGRVVAFEPVTANAARLAQNLALNGVDRHAHIVRRALSDRPGRLTMTLREDFAGGAGTGNASILIEDGTDERFATTSTEVTTLDAALGDLGRPRVGVLKVDVEGHEDRLLAGAVQTFTRDRPVAFLEWNAIYYDRREVDPTSVTQELLDQWDYRCLTQREHRWHTSREFWSDRPLDDLVLAPTERVDEVRRLLDATTGG